MGGEVSFRARERIGGKIEYVQDLNYGCFTLFFNGGWVGGKEKGERVGIFLARGFLGLFTVSVDKRAFH